VKTSNDRLHKTDQESTRSLGGRNEPAVTQIVVADHDNDSGSEDDNEHKEQIIFFCENSNKPSICLQLILYAKQLASLCTMMVQAAGYSKLPVRIYQNKWHHIPKDIQHLL
jgi:hypothetical protein